MWQYLLFLILFLCLLHLLLNYNERARLIKKVPGLRDDFLFGNGLSIMCSGVELMNLLREQARINDGIYRIWIYPYGTVVIFNPNDIEIVMSGIKHTGKSEIYDIMRPWLGDGLLLSKGTKWQERRKILTPAFHFNILRQFCEMLAENSQQMVERLSKTAGQPIDVVPVLSEFTLNSICETAMGTQLSKEDTVGVQSYKQAIYELGDVIIKRQVKVYLYSDFIFNLSALKRRQDKYLKTLHSFTESVIKRRKYYIETFGFNCKDSADVDEVDDGTYMQKKKKMTAMLDLLITAAKEGLIDGQGIQEEVDTFMFEGHDTTASGLTFCLMLLANHKEIQNKIFVELNEIFGDSDRPINTEDLTKMRYMECCIKESLRLYPPVHFVSRTLDETTILSNYKIPAGSLCHISIYDLHHRADLYPNPDLFDPDRFLPENCAGRHPYAYLPFSAGPRNCIGQKFAMMELKVAIAELVRRYEILPVTRPEEIQFIADIVLRTDKPVLVNFKRR